MFEDGDVGERVAAHGDQVGGHAGGDATRLIGDAEVFGGVDGGGLDGFQRGQAGAHQQGELLGIVAVGRDA